MRRLEQAGDDAQHARLARSGRAGEGDALAGCDFERDVEPEVADGGPRVDRKTGGARRHRATASGPRTSFTDSRIAADTATSTAESASAAVKSVAKRS